MSRGAAQIEPWPNHEGRDGFLVRTPWNEAFKDALKAQVRWPDRVWVPDSDAWWVAAEQLDVLAHLLLGHFDGYEEVDPDTGELTYVLPDGAKARQGGLFE